LSHVLGDAQSFRSCPDWCGKEKWRILPED
jgi:hypothetical protein